MRRLLMTILPLLLAVFFAGTAFAQTITLAWDANTGSNIAGYKVYYQTGITSTGYTGTEADQGASPIDVGPNTTISLTGLDGSQPHTFVVTAYTTDGQESSYSAPVSSAATIVNQAPSFNPLSPQSVAENSLLSFTVSASDPDGDALTYSASNLPQGATFNASTRTFSWTPTYTQSGNYQVTFAVSDGQLTASQTVGIGVTNVDRAPVFSATAPQSVAENSALSFTVSASDPDNDTLTYSASGLPKGATFNASTKTFSWTPSYTQSGNYQVTFTVSDGQLTASQTVGIGVTNVDRAPVFSSTAPQSVAENSSLSFTISASDPDNDTLTYSASGLPKGATFNASTRTFAWTPSYTQAGSYNVAFTASDGTLSATQSVAITVTNVDRAPVFSATAPQSVAENSALSFTVSASDPDNDTITYSASALPKGASFNASTHTFSWTPSSSQAGSYNVTFAASDGTLSATQSVAITVTSVAQAPTISGSPSTSATVGSGYVFVPTAKDADSSAHLTFSIANKPTWAIFDTATGSLQGTPASGDVGTSAPITISVSDGTLSASLAPFTITVQSASSSDPSQYTINASSTDGGTVSSSGTTTLDSGATQTYTATPQTGYYLGDLVVDGVSRGPISSYTFDSLSSDHTIEATFTPIPDGLSEPPTTGQMSGVVRKDGGDPGDNLVNGLPKSNVLYTFQVILRNQSGTAPAKVLLVLDGYAYTMSQSAGVLDTGATYNYTTALGPAASHNFIFETVDAQGNLLGAYPSQGELAGPQVELLNGRNLVGVPGDQGTDSVGVALGTQLIYGWLSTGLSGAANAGNYAALDASTAIVSGQGYFIKRTTAATLPSASATPVSPATVTVPLHPGWNLISNPYGGNIPLASAQVQKDGGAPISWLQAATDNWVINALYSYNGSDWGGTYSFAAAGGQPDAILVPWVGYWIYLNRDDASYALVVPQPTP